MYPHPVDAAKAFLGIEKPRLVTDALVKNEVYAIEYTPPPTSEVGWMFDVWFEKMELLARMLGGRLVQISAGGTGTNKFRIERTPGAKPIMNIQGIQRIMVFLDATVTKIQALSNYDAEGLSRQIIAINDALALFVNENISTYVVLTFKTALIYEPFFYPEITSLAGGIIAIQTETEPIITGSKEKMPIIESAYEIINPVEIIRVYTPDGRATNQLIVNYSKSVVKHGFDISPTEASLLIQELMSLVYGTMRKSLDAASMKAVGGSRVEKVETVTPIDYLKKR